MNTRRKFLLQGTMATTALMIAKPFNTIANTISPLTGFSVNDNKVILLHTGDHRHDRQITNRQVDFLKKNTGNLLLLHAGNIKDPGNTQLKYDVTIPREDMVTTDNNYHIHYKGNIKIGIIYAKAKEKDPVKRINDLSAWLKDSKGCKLVVCLSELCYKNKSTTIDDRRLAEESSHLDILISGHPKNYSKFAVVVRNRKKMEVIINSAAGNSCDFGNIEIGFDEYGKRNFTAINNLRKQFTVNNRV